MAKPVSLVFLAVANTGGLILSFSVLTSTQAASGPALQGSPDPQVQAITLLRAMGAHAGPSVVRALPGAWDVVSGPSEVRTLPGTSDLGSMPPKTATGAPCSQVERRLELLL